MTEVLPPPNSSHLMCSQSVNSIDLAACSGHSSSLNFGAEQDSEASSRQDYSHPPLAPLSDVGLRYMGLPSDDVRFSSDTSSHSPVYSLEPNTVHNPPQSSILGYPSYPNVYQPTQNFSAAYSNGHGGSNYFSPGSVLSMPDIKPRLGSLSSSPALAPYSRSASSNHSISSLASGPLTTRDLYTSHTPGIFRRPSDLHARSPSLRASLGGTPLSPTSSGFTSPLSATMDPSNSLSPSGSSTQVPPLGPTETVYYLTTSSGERITPEIFSRIDKGFFLADGDWTCYRRNYFSLNCSYTLNPAVPSGAIYLSQGSSAGAQVQGFAMSIAAVVDGRDGKSIELVQHTPKRDKGPQERPARVTLAPRPSNPSHSHHHGSLYDSSSFSSPNPNQPAVEATFERIQFKNATANNGKRRAAQQYYHLLVDLYADVGTQHPDRWVKIASRMSAPMVVRGRSPGHYQGERRGSGGSGGTTGGGGGSYTPGSTGRSVGDMSMSGMGTGLASSSYSGYDASRHYQRPGVNIPMEPTMSQEEAKAIEDSPCYLYYPATIWEGGENKRFKSEYNSGAANTGNLPTGNSSGNFGGYTLPSLNGDYARGCGRWEGVPESKGYFPAALDGVSLS